MFIYRKKFNSSIMKSVNDLMIYLTILVMTSSLIFTMVVKFYALHALCIVNKFGN